MGHSGSVVECLTRDRRDAGSSLTSVTALWSLSKTHLSYLSTGSTQEDPSHITERLLSGRKESNQTKNNCIWALKQENLSWRFAINKGPEQPARPRCPLIAFVIHLYERNISRLATGESSGFFNLSLRLSRMV